MPFTVIMDVHGNAEYYKALTEVHDYTVQLGDFGFGDDYDILKTIDQNHHKLFQGNHCDYNKFDELLKSGHNLGHFGSRELNGTPFFFIRGGHSIDQATRRLYVNYFPEEELSYSQMRQCEEEYVKAKPNLVIAHECPTSVVRQFFPDTKILEDWGYTPDWSSSTAQFLEHLLSLHRPAMFCHGHHHAARDAVINGTRFICSYELGTFRVGET